MNKNLFNVFLTNEYNDYVKNILNASFQESKENPKLEEKKFEFDRFNVTLDFKKKKVLLEDVLDVTAQGTAEIDFKDFFDSLQ